MTNLADTNDAKAWAREWTSRIGASIKSVRNSSDPKVSAQELSRRCGELGYPIPRNTITNLENGRRESVSVQEIVVIAQALSVPTASLIGESELTGDYADGFRAGVTAERERILKAVCES